MKKLSMAVAVALIAASPALAGAPKGAVVMEPVVADPYPTKGSGISPVAAVVGGAVVVGVIASSGDDDSSSGSTSTTE